MHFLPVSIPIAILGPYVGDDMRIMIIILIRRSGERSFFGKSIRSGELFSIRNWLIIQQNCTILKYSGKYFSYRGTTLLKTHQHLKSTLHVTTFPILS